MACKAKSLMKSGVILSTPNPKAGHGLCEDLKVLVQKFYESDEMSRMMPGKKDVVSVKVDEKQISVQKKLILGNLKEVNVVQTKL